MFLAVHTSSRSACCWLSVRLVHQSSFWFLGQTGFWVKPLWGSINKGLVPLNIIEDSFKLHPASFWLDSSNKPSITDLGAGCIILSYNPRSFLVIWSGFVVLSSVGARPGRSEWPRRMKGRKKPVNLQLTTTSFIKLGFVVPIPEGLAAPLGSSLPR